MFGKKFGLDEARLLAGAGDGVSIPTVKATLKVLGVANVVGKQVSRIVAGTNAAINATLELKAKIQAEETRDEKETSTTLTRLGADRRNRAEAAASTVRGTEQRIAGLQAQIADLQELAKKFA